MNRISKRITSFLVFSLLALAGCQPISSSNPDTGNAGAAVAGGAVGVGIAALFHAPKLVLGLAGVGGAGLGYYLSTLRFSSAEIIQAGGKVFTQGEFVTIEVPSDYLFDTNSSDFNDGVEPVLDSIYSVLARYPDNNILISGNTSGTDTDHYELKLSEARARAVASYLWMKGIGHMDKRFMPPSPSKFIYVGYGNYFPIANNLRLKSIRENSRIQITSYPSYSKLHLEHCYRELNIGAYDPQKCPDENTPHNPDADKPLPDTTSLSNQTSSNSEVAGPATPSRADNGYIPSTSTTGVIPGIQGEFSDTPMTNYNTAESAPQTTAGANDVKQMASAAKPDLKSEGGLGLAPPLLR